VPIYRIMFSAGMTFSFPPEPWAVEEAYAKLLEKTAPGSPWMVAGLAVDVLPLIPTVVALGGGVRVGLEDAPYGTSAPMSSWSMPQSTRSRRPAASRPRRRRFAPG
jgi:3-keto-5-aminohexanoate cleavage enzyme